MSDAKLIECTCEWCGGAFQGHRKTRRFCSTSCVNKSYRKHFGRKPRRGKAHCASCGTVFERSRNGLRKFCNRKCQIEFEKDYLYDYNNRRRRQLRWSHPWRMPIEAAKTRSRAKKFDFDLTEAWAISRWTGRCEVTNLPFNAERTSKGPSIFAPSIDRIDSTKGYTQDNCRFVLTCVNFFKNNGTDDDMYMIATALIRERIRRTPHSDQHVAALLAVQG